MLSRHLVNIFALNFLLITGLRKHDVAFLVTLRPAVDIGYQYKYKEPFIPQVGLTYVRGCEIEGMLDDMGKVIEEGENYLYSVYRSIATLYWIKMIHQWLTT